MEFWHPDDGASPDPAWWAALMRFGLAMARDGSHGRYVPQDRRSAWWHLDLIDFSPALQPDRSEQAFDEPPADEANWVPDDLSAA